MNRLFFSTIFFAALTACSIPSFTSKQSEAPAAKQPAPAPAPSVAPPAPVAQTAAVATPAPATASLLSEDTNVAGVAADVTECKRKEGVLSVKVRFRNASSPTPAQVVLFQGNDTYKTFYVTAANKKYFMLQDSDGAYLTSAAGYGGSLTVTVTKDQPFTWWAKFPAPPPEVKKVTLFLPVASPLEDIPVTDQ